MHEDVLIALTDEERAQVAAWADARGLTVEAMAHEFIRRHLLYIGRGASLPRPADILPFPKKALHEDTV